MTDAPPAAPPAADPAAPSSEDAWLADLPEHVRKTWEQKNGEAAHYRHQLRDAQKAASDERERREQLERDHESEQQRIVREAIERDREAEAGKRGELVAGYEQRLAVAAIERKAAGTFADPTDAVRLLPLDELLDETDERRRADLVDKALAKLLEDKPYLARDPAPRPPLVTQGARSEQRGDGRRERGSWLRS